MTGVDCFLVESMTVLDRLSKEIVFELKDSLVGTTVEVDDF